MPVVCNTKVPSAPTPGFQPIVIPLHEILVILKPVGGKAVTGINVLASTIGALVV